MSTTIFIYRQIFTKFESLIELQISSNIDLFFIGVFNIHIDGLNDYDAHKFHKLLNSFDLLQYVTHLTHDSGLTIHLVITNSSSKFVICPFLLHTHMSDHKNVCFDLDLQKLTVHKTAFSCHKLKKPIYMNLMNTLQLLFPMLNISTMTSCYSYLTQP